ncbi:MAG TPA: AMP-binding protein [Polyangiaceae bacterium]|nr:AMP-binding protein [Polyangiaceae bacterium]
MSSLLARWLARVDDARCAVAAPEGPVPWIEIVERADCVASALLAGRGSLEGERVALLLAPGAAIVASLFGVLRAGGAVVMLSPGHPARETSYYCEDAEVSTVITSRSLAHLAGDLRRRVAIAEDLFAGRAASIAAVPGEGVDALQIYTSGTTSRPKGAVLTHANLGIQQALLSQAWGLRQDDVLLHVLPLHHIHGLGIALLSALGCAASVRFLDFAGRGFDARATWDAMEGASVFMAVPSIHARLMAAFDAADATTQARWTRFARALRLVTSGSAPLPVSLGARWEALTGAYPLERFGMTELGVAASNPLASERRRPGTVGLPLPTVQTRIVDDDGRPADTGHLWIAGPSVFSRYHGRPESNEDAFALDTTARWFKTGDTVLREHDGYLRVLGRTSVDILKSGGYKLSALEIEEAIREHPSVAEVAVVGIPDPHWGDRVVACVVAREGCESDLRPDWLRGFLKERIAAYKVPKQVVVLHELPKNALGKVIKPDLVKKLT